MYRVSVVIPVYKVEQYISHTMQSLLNQTTRDFEVILVDDGTPDRSIEVAEAILKTSDVAYRILKQSNSGQGIARNTGVAAAQGEWIFFLDSDDVLQPDTLEGMLKLIQQYPNTDIVYSGFQYVYEDPFQEGKPETVVETFNTEQMLHGFLVRSKVVLVPGTLYRKQFLEENCLKQTGIRWSEDQLFMWNVLSCVKQAVHTDRQYYNYYRHPGSVMNATPVEKIVEAYSVWKETLPKLGNAQTKKYALSRWVLGCIREYAKRSEYAQWADLAKKMDAQEHMRKLRSFPSKKVQLLALLGGNLKLLYCVLRSWRR